MTSFSWAELDELVRGEGVDEDEALNMLKNKVVVDPVDSFRFGFFGVKRPVEPLYPDPTCFTDDSFRFGFFPQRWSLKVRSIAFFRRLLHRVRERRGKKECHDLLIPQVRQGLTRIMHEMCFEGNRANHLMVDCMTRTDLFLHSFTDVRKAVRLELEHVMRMIEIDLLSVGSMPMLLSTVKHTMLAWLNAVTKLSAWMTQVKFTVDDTKKVTDCLKRRIRLIEEAIFLTEMLRNCDTDSPLSDYDYFVRCCNRVPLCVDLSVTDRHMRDWTDRLKLEYSLKMSQSFVDLGKSMKGIGVKKRRTGYKHSCTA